MEFPGRRLPLAVTVVVVLGLSPPGRADGREGTESSIKAAIVYNFTKFVHWPTPSEDGPDSFDVAILGDDEVCDALRTLEGKRVGDRAIRIVESEDPDSFLTCSLVYFGSSRTGMVDDLLQGLDGHPVLTVSDVDEFADTGGMVQLVRHRGKIGFRVNPSSARRCELRISSQLLKMATLVGDE